MKSSTRDLDLENRRDGSFCLISNLWVPGQINSTSGMMVRITKKEAFEPLILFFKINRSNGFSYTYMQLLN